MNEKLLAEYKAIYSDSSLAPSASFSQGHVAPADLRDYLKKTQNGFVVQLPGNTLVPSPVYYKGKIYLSGGFGSKRYYSFDYATGENMKTWDLDDDGPSSAAVSEDILVFNTESCTIFAIDLKTGKQLWSWWLGDPLMCMPTIANGRVFTAYPAGFQHTKQQVIWDYPLDMDDHQVIDELRSSLNHVLIVFDLKTGKVLWQRWIDGDVMSAPVAYEHDLFVTTFSGTLYKFSQKTGELLSVSKVRATSAPVITKQGIFISKRADEKGEDVSEELVQYNSNNITANKTYYKKKAIYLDKNVQGNSNLKSQASEMDAGNGFTGGAPQSSGWQKANEMIGQSNVSSLQSFQGSRTLNYMNRNYSTMGDELICNDPETGKNIWKIKITGDLAGAGGFIGTPPLEVGGRIIIATYSGEILIINAKSGEVEQKYLIDDPVRYQPIVWDGWIYVTTTNSRLHAINTGNMELTGWPMWGGNTKRTNESVE